MSITNKTQAYLYHNRRRKAEQRRGNPPLALSNFTPPDGQVSVGYSYNSSNSFTGGAIVTYTLVGTLPTGLNLNPSSGIISGTPTVANTFTDIRIIGTNADGSSTTIKADITIIA